jgi:hypothetical protein
MLVEEMMHAMVTKTMQVTCVVGEILYFLVLISKLHVLLGLVEGKTVFPSFDIQVTCVIDVC